MASWPFLENPKLTAVARAYSRVPRSEGTDPEARASEGLAELIRLDREVRDACGARDRPVLPPRLIAGNG